MNRRYYFDILKPVFLCFAGFLATQVQGQILANYITEAQKNNAHIEALRLDYQVSKEKENQADALPDTKFSLGYFISSPETRVGPQQASISASQQLPWFGTLTARENYAQALSEVGYQNLAIAKRKLSLNVSKAFYELYGLQAQITVIDHNIALLENYRQLALSDVENDRASAVDVMQLRIRENDLKDKKETVTEQFNSKAGHFNQLLNRPIQQIPIIPDTLILPEEDALSIENLTIHPELIKYDKLYSAITESEAVNQKQAAPDFGIGLNYINVEQRDVQIADNGKDIIMPMVSLSIPIFNNRYASISRQHKLEHRRVEAKKQNHLLHLKSRANESLSNQKSARHTIQTQLKNLEQTRDALSVLKTQYETGILDYDEVLDLQDIQLQIQLKKIDAVTYFFIQHAHLNYLSQKEK